MSKQINVALIGNPNTGKTSVFNSLLYVLLSSINLIISSIFNCLYFFLGKKIVKVFSDLLFRQWTPNRMKSVTDAFIFIRVKGGLVILGVTLFPRARGVHIMKKTKLR